SYRLLQFFHHKRLGWKGYSLQSNSSFQDADVLKLKLDILAPSNLIWAAWAPNGTDESNYAGKRAVLNDEANYDRQIVTISSIDGKIIRYARPDHPT
ncbi:hypothetical protein ACJX0J_033157, partial [Zea mays]